MHKNTTFRVIILFILYCITICYTAVSAEGSNLSAESAVNDPLDDNDNLISAKAISTEISYTCNDSISVEVELKDILLLGSCQVAYKDMKINCHELKFNWDTNDLFAYKTVNNIDGVDNVNYILFSDKSDNYIMEELHYNLDSKKAICYNIRTKQNDGIADLSKVKKLDNDEFFIKDGTYTTCKLEHRHFHIYSKKARLIKNKKIITGPFNLNFSDISSPIGFFLGIFPASKDRQSGILFPNFGLSSSSDFYLNDFGYYHHINDYLGLALINGFKSQNGSFYTKPIFSYAKRYKFKGMLSYKWEDNSTGVSDDIFHEFKFDHNTIKRRGGKLSASINIKNKRSGSAVSDRVSVKDLKKEDNLRSFISYGYNNIFNSVYSLRSLFDFNHNFTKKLSKLTAPDINLYTDRIYPLKMFNKNSVSNWGSMLSIQHTFSFMNKADNVINEKNETIPFFANFKERLKKGHYGIKNDFPIHINTSILKHILLNIEFKYSEIWYDKKFDYDTNDYVKGFYRLWNFDLSNKVSTALYGFATGNSKSRFSAIRHKLMPSIGFKYRPKHSDYYFKSIKYGKKAYLSKFKDGVYGDYPRKAKAILSFELDNNVEIKVRNSIDNIEDENFKIISIFRTLSFSSGYDFLAKKFKFQDIEFNFNNSFLDGFFDISVNASIDPYINDGNERINKLAWKELGRIGDISSGSLNLNFKLKPISLFANNKSAGLNKNSSKDDEDNHEDTDKDDKEDEEDKLFDIPWTLKLGYSYRYMRQLPSSKHYKPRKIINFDGDVKLTKLWKLNAKGAYDINDKKFKELSIGLNRDLHCWEMDFEWHPLKDSMYFEFVLKVKSNILKHVKYRSKGSL